MKALNIIVFLWFICATGIFLSEVIGFFIHNMFLAFFVRIGLGLGLGVLIAYVGVRIIIAYRKLLSGGKIQNLKEEDE